MQAALITGKELIEFVDFDDPSPEPEQIVVDITYCGICGTDIHAFQSDGAHGPPHGHEWTGFMSKAGSSVDRLSEGDRVVIAVPIMRELFSLPVWANGKVPNGSNGHGWKGPFATPHGGFAKQLAIHHGRAVKANSDLSDEQAAQIEPAAICFHAVRANPPRLGEVAVIQGAGPIGLSTLQWVRVAGAGTIVVVEPNDARRNLSLALGAHHAVSPSEATEFISNLTKGLGADIVYECAGIPATIQSAVDLARRGGRAAIIGLAMGDAPISPRQWLTKEIQVTAALGYTHEEFEMTMGYVADGRIDLDVLTRELLIWLISLKSLLNFHQA